MTIDKVRMTNEARMTNNDGASAPRTTVTLTNFSAQFHSCSSNRFEQLYGMRGCVESDALNALPTRTWAWRPKSFRKERGYSASGHAKSRIELPSGSLVTIS